MAAASGCGPTPPPPAANSTLDDVMRGLWNAAKSKKTFDAVTNSNDLAKTERAVVNAFCSVTTQLADNGETLGEQQYFDAMSNAVRAELGVLDAPAQAALTKVRTTYDLASINPQAAIRFANACYR